MNLNTYHAVLQSLANWVWANSLAGTVLIGLVWLARLIGLKKLPPRWQYTLWMLVVLRLLLPVAPSAAFSVFNLGRSFSPISASPDAFTPFTSGPLPAMPTTIPSGHTAPVDLLMKAQQARITHQLSLQNFLSAAPYLWLAGALAYFLAVCWQHRRLAAWVKRQEPIPDLIDFMNEARTLFGLRRKVHIVAAASLSTPALFGFFRPRLLVPKPLLQQRQELRMVLLHEFAHLKRGDVLQNWLFILVQSLHWFNPAVWLALKRLRADRELVCDAMVLARLNSHDQHAYGAALLKLVEQFSKPLSVPTLVPVLNYKPQIHRRISMIAHFKATPRLVTVAAGLLVLALAGVTFTGAAEKDKPKASDKSVREPDLPKRGNDADARIQFYEKEITRIDEQIRKAQKEADTLRSELGITSESQKIDFPETLRELERERIIAQSECAQAQSLYTQLAKLSRPELLKMIPTASPDPLLLELCKHKQVAEQNLAESSEKFGKEHPEVKTRERVLKQINEQISERLDGILQGLKIKTESYKQKVEALKTEVDKVKKNDIESSIMRVPYFKAKRDLETLQAARERLQYRMLEERIDNGMPRRNTPADPTEKSRW